MFNQNPITMEKYMFIFVGGEARHLSPEAQQAHLQKWFAWIEKLTNEKRYVAGEALLPGGKTVKGVKKTITDGPFTESKEVVGGFFIVYAKNIDEAATLAKDCPDYELGGIVEVREIQKFDI
jgi:hypothetical protein